jgi:hypothetical protein
VVKKQKLYQRIVNNQKNVKFNQLISIVEAFGFILDRIKGVITPINIQKFQKLFWNFSQAKVAKQNPIRSSSS